MRRKELMHSTRECAGQACERICWAEDIDLSDSEF